jgi:chaperonin GroES
MYNYGPLSIDEIKKSPNVAELLDSNCLACIADEVIRGYNIDEKSRSAWKDTITDAMDIAMQIMEEKSFPWPGASNIKYPLIAQASIDYSSRTVPEIIQNKKIVKISIQGMDKDGKKWQRARNVASYVSYDLMVKSPDWVDGTDKLIQILPVLGTVFKKTYYDEVEKRVRSDLCVPDKIVVNYGTQSLESARRVTHLLKFYKNDVITRQRKGLFLQKDSKGNTIDIDVLLSNDKESAIDDCDKPMVFLEQHCYLDLDDDGYMEPYIVTVHKDSNQVFRIIPRFKSVETNSKNEIVRIVPEQCFTDYHFIRSPDGGYYSMGFGSLLLPINQAINTLANQLVDSGTLNNMQGGLIGRGVRLKGGEIEFKMGKWLKVDSAAGEDLAKNIFPWPTKEPSKVLFQLLGLFLQAGKDLSSTTDVLQGKQPAQNVANGTIQQLIEQGTKFFKAINQRLYRSLEKEYRKLLELYSTNLTQKEYVKVLDDPTANVKDDFNLDDMDIYPVADPSVSTEAERMAKAGIVAQLPTVDRRAADRMVLEAMQLDEDTIARLQPPVDPNAPPPPDVQKTMSEIKLNDTKATQIQLETTLAAQKMQSDLQEAMANIAWMKKQMEESDARQWKMMKDAAHGDAKIAIAGGKMQQQGSMKQFDMVHKHNMDNQDLQIKAVSEVNKKVKNDQDAQLKAAEIAAKLEIAKEKGKEDGDSSNSKYNEKDIAYTARLKGISVAKARQLLKNKEN